MTYLIMLRTGYGFGDMHCLVLVNIFQEGYQKAGHLPASLKKGYIVSITHFWILLCFA